MNKLFLLMSAVVLAGCAGAQPEPVKYQPVGMANPAAVYCHEKGGTSVRVQTAQGGRIVFCRAGSVSTSGIYIAEIISNFSFGSRHQFVASALFRTGQSHKKSPPFPAGFVFILRTV